MKITQNGIDFARFSVIKVCAIGALLGATQFAIAGDPCSPHWIDEPGLPGADDDIQALVVFDNGDGPRLYAGGRFNLAGNSTSVGIARWEPGAPGQWQFAGISDGFPFVSSFAVFNSGNGNELFAANFDLIRYSGTQWSDVPGSPSSVHSGIGTYDGPFGQELFVSGGFVFQTPQGLAEYIVRYDGTSFSPIGEGLNSVAHDFVMFDDGSGEKLFAVGGFAFFESGLNAVGVATWDGNKWEPLAGGTNGSCYAVEVFDDGDGPALYVGGNFSRVGINTSASCIAKWDGATWSTLGTGLTTNGVSNAVRAMAVYDDGSGSGPALFVAGDFLLAGGQPATRIAKWNGTSWSAVGGGANNKIHTLQVFESNGRELLAVGGEFTMVDGKPANRIAFYGCDQPILGDLDNNGGVDVFDLFILLSNWGTNGPGADLAPANNVVDVFDLFVLLGNWG